MHIIECPFCGAESKTGISQAERYTCPKCGKTINLVDIKTARYGQDQQGSNDKTNPPLTPKPPANETESLLSPGVKLGQYEIRELIGRGGMGTVYKAHQPLLERFVAIKTLPTNLANDPEFVKRFNREAKALAGLSHPNIITIYDIGRENKYFYFIMEFVEGVTIRDLLEDRKLKPEETLKIIPQLCEALEYAHAEGVVHRDIKPENILIDKKGRVKITDFGLARIIKGDIPFEPITKTREIMGTYDYMAPEQREDSKNVDHRADIYSLGVVFYEMLTGELPIGKFALPSQKVQIDVRLDDVVLKALEKEPARRYQRASELGEAVTEVITSAPIKKELPSDELKPRYSNATMVISIIGLFMLISVAAFFLYFKVDSSTDSVPPDTESGQIQSKVLYHLCLANEIYHRADLNEDYSFDYAVSIKELCEDKVLAPILGKEADLMAQADQGILGDQAQPYHGYFYRTIPESMDLKPKELIYQEETFTFAAYPASTNLPTYIIDQRGIIYAQALGNLKYPDTWTSYQVTESTPGKWEKKMIDPADQGWTIVQRLDLGDTVLKNTWTKVKPALPQITPPYTYTPEDLKIIKRLKEHKFSAEFKDASYEVLFEALAKEFAVDIQLTPAMRYNFPYLLSEQLPSLKLMNLSGETALKTILNLSRFNLTYEVKKGIVYIIWRRCLLPPLDEKSPIDPETQKTVQNLLNEIKQFITEINCTKAQDLLGQLYHLIPESDEVRYLYWYLVRAEQEPM